MRKIAAFTNPEAKRFQHVTVYHDAEWEEYRVVPKGRPQASYHTNDRTDAINTARVMAGLSVN